MLAIPMDFISDPVVYTWPTNRGTEMKLEIITMNAMKETKEVKLSNCCFMIEDPYTKRLKFLIELSLLGSR